MLLTYIHTVSRRCTMYLLLASQAERMETLLIVAYLAEDSTFLPMFDTNQVLPVHYRTTTAHFIMQPNHSHSSKYLIVILNQDQRQVELTVSIQINPSVSPCI